MQHKNFAKSISNADVSYQYPEEASCALKILVVEDDPLTQFIHKKMLKSLNCVVDVADNALDALKLLDNHYDLIMTDINLPGMNGISFAKTVRKISTYQNTPIVAITTLADTVTNSVCIQAGINRVLTKPARVEVLNEIISTKKSFDL